jgi:hypothetical protein
MEGVDRQTQLVKSPRFGGVSFMNKVTFRCKRSGNTVSFSLEGDIEGMRKHEGYEEIKDGYQEEIRQKTSEEVLIRARGRPRKQEI